MEKAEDNKKVRASTYKSANTFINALVANDKTGDSTIKMNLLWCWSTPFSSTLFPQMQFAPNGNVQNYSFFLSSLDVGTLPNFCFLEPYHPPASVKAAKYNLDQLYERLKTSPQ